MLEEKVLDRIEEMRNLPLMQSSHLFIRYKDKSIGEAARNEAMHYGSNPIERPAIALLEVILSTNRKYTTHVEPHIMRLRKTDLSTFKQLEYRINQYSIEEFFEFWGPHDQRRFEILKCLMSAISDLKDKLMVNGDYDVMNKWAIQADLSKWKYDIIGRIHGIGLATFQHLRMNFGVNTVKPDRQVKKVLEKEFGIKVTDEKAIIEVEKLSKISGYSMIELDQIFVNYGSGYYESEKENAKSSFICKNKK